MNASTQVLGMNECNSGMTCLSYPGRDETNGEIYIYRKEEFYKVLIHELLHSNYTDEKIMKEDTLNRIVCSSYPILVHEIYVETLATIFHLFYYACVHGLDDIGIPFEIEKRYALYMRQKILKHYGISSIHDILKKKTTSCKKSFPQGTNVFSYYIFKPNLLYSMSEFGEWMQTYTHHVTLLDSHAFLKFLDEKMEMDFTPLLMRAFEKEYHIPQNTMRMTYWG
jgi:hypothetical protein